MCGKSAFFAIFLIPYPHIFQIMFSLLIIDFFHKEQMIPGRFAQMMRFVLLMLLNNLIYYFRSSRSILLLAYFSIFKPLSIRQELCYCRLTRVHDIFQVIRRSIPLVSSKCVTYELQWTLRRYRSIDYDSIDGTFFLNLLKSFVKHLLPIYTYP